MTYANVEALLMHPDDNVLVAVVDLPAGHVTGAGGAPLAIPKPVPGGHKFARRALAAGEIVVKYGQPVGRVTAAIEAGGHVHVHNVESLRGRGDLAVAPALVRDTLLRGTQKKHSAAPGLVSELSGQRTFPGYRRRDGRVGVRNHVLVMSTVGCANGAVRRIGQVIPGVVPLTHVYGCSQLGDDLAQTARVLEGFASHPNVAGVLLVGLGCESLDSAALARRLAEAGTRVEYLSIQAEGGTGATSERGAGLARRLLAQAADEARAPVPLADLIVGLECGGSDAWSGITANPALGLASDALVALGGTAMLSETPEFIGAEHLLAARSDPELGAALCAAVARWEGEARRMGVDMRGAQPTPGNIAGGLTTIEEKSLGAIAKGGSSPVVEFLPYAARPARRGLVVMDTPGNDPESVTGMVAGGAQLVVFTTGRGSPAGCPVAPVIKVATNTALAGSMADDMDLDAGTVISRSESLADAGSRILTEIVEVASGKLTAAERWDNAEFAINMIGPRV